MKHKTKRFTQRATAASNATGLDAQFAELIETVWACERRWALEDRIDGAVRCRRL